MGRAAVVPDVDDRETGQDARHAGLAALRVGARGGLVARGVFYLLLVYLTTRIATVSGGRQADANGALRIVGTSLFSSVILGFASFGFLLFGVVRLKAAWCDADESRLSRATTALQGISSLVVSWIPLSFALGSTSTGSAQQSQQHANRLLGLPGGRVLVVIIGVIVLGWAAWQVRGAIRQDFSDGLDTSSCRPWVRRAVTLVSASGLAARAVVIAPIGIFFFVAAAAFDPHRASGLDGELQLLSGHVWGKAVLALVALGLADFAAYAFIEARFRQVEEAG